MRKRWRIAAIAVLVMAGLALWSDERLIGTIRKGLDILTGRLREQGLRPTGLWIRDHGLRRLQGMSPVDTSQIAPGLFVGGQHYRHGLPRMAALGISATLNLREETNDSVRGVALARHLWLPAVDDTPPTLDQLSRAVEFTRQSLKEGRGVYIHCAAGVGRAPTTAAAYLVSTGLAPTEAWALIRRTRPFIRPRLVQIDQVDRFYQAQNSK